MNEQIDVLVLWVFPERDFGEWHRLTVQHEGKPIAGEQLHNNTYQEYLDSIREAQSKGMKMGAECHVVQMKVAEMVDQCKARGLPYSPPSRLTVLNETLAAMLPNPNCDQLCDKYRHIGPAKRMGYLELSGEVPAMSMGYICSECVVRIDLAKLQRD